MFYFLTTIFSSLFFWIGKKSTMKMMEIIDKKITRIRVKRVSKAYLNAGSASMDAYTWF